jgi:hypothetical protein
MAKPANREGHGLGLVNVGEIEKIGLVEWFEIRKHSRMYYLPLDQKDVRMHDLQIGDKIRAKLDIVVHQKREREE